MFFVVFLYVFVAVLEAFEGALKLVMMGSDGFYQKLTLPGPYVSFLTQKRQETCFF